MKVMNSYNDDGSLATWKNDCPPFVSQFTRQNGLSNKRILIITSHCLKNSTWPSYLFKSPFITHIGVLSQYFTSLTEMLQLAHPTTAEKLI